MISFLRLFRKYKLDNVFTPGTIARINYVNRSVLEKDVEKFLFIPGIQIVLYGHSGCGKSTLIYNKLAACKLGYITTSCKSDTTLNDILLQAFDKLNVYYTSEKSHTKKVTISQELKAQYKLLSSSISTSTTEEKSLKDVRVLPVQLTPERLAEFLGAVKCKLVIEDFHKVKDDEKKKLADVLKIFMDSSKDYPEVKIICIGAVSSARELMELDSNLSTRVAEIHVPLLKDDELLKIVLNGFRILNIFCKREIKDKIIYYSNNLASVCHQICYDICHNRGIMKSRLIQESVDDKDFNDAVLAYVRKNSDTFTKVFDKITTLTYGKHLLKALINTEKEYASYDDLFKEIKKISPVTNDTLTNMLVEFTSVECFEVLRYDSNSKCYFFSSPFFQAFTKMKLAIEEAEREERNVKKRKGFRLRDRDYGQVKYHFTLDDKLYENITIELNNYYSKRFRELQKTYEESKKNKKK